MTTEAPSVTLDSAAARLRLRMKISDTPYRSVQHRRPLIVRWITITYEQRAGADVIVEGWSARLVGVWMNNDGTPTLQPAEAVVQVGLIGDTDDHVPGWLKAIADRFRPDLGTPMSVALGAVL